MRPQQRDAGSVLYMGVRAGVGEARLLADEISAHLDIVRYATRLDLDAALAAIEDKGHGDHGLERIALGPARRGDISFPRGNAHAEIEQGLNGFVGDAGAIVGDDDLAV